MLQTMRKYTKSWISSIFMGALALSFGVWGIADIFKGTTDTNVAVVGGTAIGSDVYQREYNNVLKQQADASGRPMQSDVARKLGVPGQVLNQMVNRAALDNVGAKLGLTTGDAPVVTEIRAARAFAGPLGTFDHDSFLRAINDRGYTEQGFLELVRNDITRNQLLAAGRAGFALPDGYVAALFSYLNEVRAVDYVILPANAGGTVPTPTDAQLIAYVKSHAGQFSTPEYRELDYAEISPDDIASQTKPTETQLRQQYELRKDDPRFGYQVPEKRDVEQITFSSEADAKAAKAKIDSGTSFADAAKAAGKTVDNLGSLAKADLGTRGPAVFALAADGVTDPQKNLTGWVLLHVTKITPGVNKSFDDVKADIAKDVVTELAQAKLGDISNAYTDANSGGLSLIEAGKKVGMHTGHLAAVDASGRAPDGSITPIAADPDFVKQVFAAEVGEDGDPFPVKSGKVYVLKVDGVIPPKLKPLDQVRAQATAQWTEEQRQKMLVAKADALVAQANAEHNLAAASAVAGTPVEHSGRLDRNMPQDATGKLSGILIGKIFEAPPGTAVAAPGANGQYVVARVTGVLHRPLPKESIAFIQGSRQLNAQSAQDMDSLLADAARDNQHVKINQANADRVTGSGEGS